MKPVDVNPGMCIHFNKRNNKEDPEFEVGNHVRISKYKDIFAKSYFPIWSKKAFVITKVKNAVLWAHVICDLIGKQNCYLWCQRRTNCWQLLQMRIAKNRSKKSWKSNKQKRQ